MINLKDKKVLITGSSRGIGAEIAKKMAAFGAEVIINYAHSEERAEKVKAEIEGAGGTAHLLQADVSNFDQAADLIKTAYKKMGGLDVLVNNAGITRDKLLMRMKEEDWDQVLDINLKGVFNCTKNAIRYMMKQRHGKIVNLSSVVGLMGNAGQANYSASKAGIVGFTKSVAREVSKRGINVNAVAPGYINTDMTEELPAKVKEDMLKNIPLDRFGEVEDVANVILFLVSPLSSYVNGQTINIDGGMLM